MPTSKLSKEAFGQLLSNQTERYTVVGPVNSRLAYQYAVVTDLEDLQIESTTTVLPPKKQFLPQIDSLLKLRRDGNASVINPLSEKPVLLIGMHSCDLVATELIDKIFAVAPGDPYYKARREQAVVIGVRCTAPCDDHAFCNVIGTLDQKGGADLFLTPLEDAYLIESLTDKGREFLKGTALEKADDADGQSLDAMIHARDSQFRSHDPIALNQLSDAMVGAKNDPVWDELANRCLSCGTCNTTCPTCYCFDLCDKMELNLNDGTRERSWDSCQLREFATVAGGENFRERRADRQRHRFYRKGKYLFDRYDLTGCVGCGRCVRQCVADIDPLDLYRTLLERRAAGV